MSDSFFTMSQVRLVKHAPGAPGLRILGLGPSFIPTQGLSKLQKLLDKHAFWAKNRSFKNLKILLAGSKVIISLWKGKRLIGFGRATSDGIYRAVLWDIVVADDLQRKGLGRRVVEELLAMPAISKVEKVYLMTTHSSDFYEQLGFDKCSTQELLIKSKNISKTE